MSTVFTAIFLPGIVMLPSAFKHCEIRMKINAGPSGREAIALQKEDSMLVFDF